MGIRPIGAVVGGVVGGLIGVRETMLLAAIGGVCATFWLVHSPVLRLREMPEAAEA
jgi:hypothetical protein